MRIRLWSVLPGALVLGALPLLADAHSALATPRQIAGSVFTYTVVRGDSLTRIGSTFGVDAATLAAENQLNPAARLSVGQHLRIDNRHIVPAEALAGEITINIPQRLLISAVDGVVDAMPVAVGRPTWRTPTGAFTITVVTTDPTWYVPASILEESARRGRAQPPVVPPGPDNPLGAVWIGLSLSGIGIHGTTQRTSIYHPVTHGCVRLSADNVERLRVGVGPGTAGRIIYRPILLASVDGEIYLEAHRDIYGQLSVSPLDEARALARHAGLAGRIDWEVAGHVVAEREGVARRVTAKVTSALRLAGRRAA